MEDYKEFPELLGEEILERAARFGTAQLCDGMKGLGVHQDGCMEAAILPADDTLSFAGTACTVETDGGDNFPIHAALYQCRPGDVLVIDGKGFLGSAYIGDLIVGAAKAIGVSGIVIDGCVRDKAGLRETGLPVYAKGYMQKGPSKKGPGKINVPIVCGGVGVEPGDLVVGDCDGVTVVPRRLIETVLEAAAKKEAYEEKRREAIAHYARCREKGEPLPELAPDWVLEMLKNQ